MAGAAILTIGNELVSGDVPNSNGAWLARRLAPLGVAVRLIAAVPDETEAIAGFVRREAPLVDFLIVTGGLGGTPDDITREAIAYAFSVAQEEMPELAADLRSRFTGDPEYAAAWARLPVGSRPLPNPLGGAPGFALGDGGDVRRDRGGVPPRRADRVVAAALPDAGERHRAAPRRGGGALAVGAHRLVPGVPTGRPPRRGGGEIE